MRATRLPEWAIRLLEFFSSEQNRDIVVGDFAEIYSSIAGQKGKNRAVFWYLTQLIQSIPSFLFQHILFAKPMLGAYGKSAIRNLRKRKFFSSLNIVGLAIGMATCLLILNYVVFESSYDEFHEYEDDLYRVVVEGIEQGDGTTLNGRTWRGLKGAIRDQVPGVLQVTRVHSNGTASIMYRPDLESTRIFRQPSGFFVEPSFFEIFSYKILTGNPDKALSSLDQMFVSEAMAKKYFGNQNPIGKTLEIEGWTRGSYTVTGVFENPSAQSHLHFEYLLPLKSLFELPQYSSQSEWKWQNFTSYVQLHPETNPESLSPLLTRLVHDNTTNSFSSQSDITALLQPITDIHLKPNGKADAKYWRLYLFGVVGILVLVIAWMNFANLTTASAMERAKEVGIRKCIGATKRNLIIQFITEATITNGVAFLLAAALIAISSPYLEPVLGISVSAGVLKNPTLWLVIAFLFLFGISLSCFYPAIILSRFEPMTIIKSKVKSNSSKQHLRKTLVVLQFTVATVLLIGTVAVFSQLHYMQSLDIGLELEGILVIEEPTRADKHGTATIFKQELSRVPEVQAVSSSAVPGTGFFMDMPARKLGEHELESKPFQAVFIDDTFLKTYNVELVAGRNFKDTKSDGLSTILNETGVQVFGFPSAEAAIGQRIVFNEDESNFVTIIGVAKNFNWMSVKENMGAIGFLINQSEGPYSIKIQTNDIEKTLSTIKQLFEKVYPESPFDYYFADERFNAQYLMEMRSAMLFGIFSFLTLFVACLGLIGLIANLVSKRTKEIGIRKIMGASSGTIASLLVTGLAKSLGIALPIAVLISHFFINQWLESYATRIDLTPLHFLLPCIVILIIAVLTISYHTLRAALSNPVVALKTD